MTPQRDVADALNEARAHMRKAMYALNRARLLVEKSEPVDQFESGVIHSMHMSLTTLMTEVLRCSRRVWSPAKTRT